MTRSPLALASAAAAGIVFGIGLSIARMTDPTKIKDFLDLAAIPTGGWDPSLAFVMGGGLLVAFFGLRLNRYLRKPIAAPAFIQTHRTKVDAPLVAGAVVFGVGWGLSGFCPGPSFADLGLIPEQVIGFVVALLVGSWIAGQIMAWTEMPPTSGTSPADAPAR
jgi:uncharacterized membrane protein YedE/YeeE